MARAKMKAMVLREAGGSFRLEEVPVPEPGPGEALIKVRACGAGLTIHHTKVGRAPATYPRILGHEIAGEIVELGPGVEGLKVGDRVTPHFYLTCGRCKWCLMSRETLCSNLIGFVGRHVDGGYAEYTKLPARNLVRLPDGLPYEESPGEVAIISDAIATPYKVTRKGRIAPLEDVVVIGAGGGVGIHMVQMAKMLGARVIAVDIGKEKLAMARECGAHEVIDAAKGEVSKEVKRLTDGRGADVVVSFVALKEPMEEGLKSLGTGGRLITLGGYSDGPFLVDALQVLRGELEIIGSRYVTLQELAESLELVARGLIKPIVTRTFRLEEAEEAHRLLERGEVVGRAVLLMS